ncbi:hypothetical protein ACIOMM_31070 [Streptomyces sp. NPDC087908]|uniref:hypothetical protein n=1 Tax=Streptomyces sp. NPDC087908 TaxID=3365820 RepID=UPI00380533E6
MSTHLFTAAAALHPARDGYALAYGSHATRPRLASDLDLLYTGTAPLPPARLARLIDGVKRLHADHGLDIEEEVAFTSKLYATTREIENAARLGGFEGVTDYATPVGDPDALNSPRFKARLLLNALTTPHVFLTGDVHGYRRHVAAAERGAALLALRITGAGKIPLARAAHALLSSPEGLTEKRFLGYRHETHLHAVLHRGLLHLVQEGQVHIDCDTITWRAT